MADDLKHLKDQIWFAKKKISEEETEHQTWLESKQSALQLLEADPDNAEVRSMLAEVEDGLATVEKSLASQRTKLAALETKLPTAPQPTIPKFDPEKHPLLKKTLEKPEVEKPIIVLNTGDVCEAQWPADKQWYKAKIKTILGAASAPKYHVLFVDYGDTMTLDSNAVRPLQNKRKREGDSTNPFAGPASTGTPMTSTPHVISGPASVNPNAQLAKQDGPNDAPEPKKRKIPNKKALEKGVASWKSWNSKGIGKKIAQKESMFRSGTTLNSRVGFTGSGAGMSETKQRIRHNNKADAEQDANENGD